MYYVLMKTLIRPCVKSTIAISPDQLYRQNIPESISFKHKKLKIKWKILLIFMSIFTFIVVTEMPEKNASICNKHYSEKICMVW